MDDPAMMRERLREILLCLPMSTYNPFTRQYDPVIEDVRKRVLEAIAELEKKS